MPDSPLKLKPIKDLLDEVLGTVEPIATYAIGDTLLEFWKPDHISEAHNLRLVACQVEQMVMSRQYTALLQKINELSDRTDVDANLQAQVNSLTGQMAEKLEDLLPLNCQYLEALAELEPGQLLAILKEELSKRNTRKQLPMALFVNTLVSKVKEAMAPIEEEAEEALAAIEPAPEDDETDPLEPTTTIEVLSEPSASTNNAKQLVTTSAT